MRKLIGFVLILFGLALCCNAAVMYGEQVQHEEIAAENAEIILVNLEQAIEEKVEQAIIEPEPEEPPKGEMPKITWNGYDLVGIISVPSFDIDLPVLQNWDFDMLDLAPCRYSGNITDGNLIIMGHNYKGHFKTLLDAKAGTEIHFKDAYGNEYLYMVTATEKLGKNDLDKLTGTDYDMSICTCTFGGQNRFILRCQLVGQKT
ncbi:MAG: sortase [Clostridia bacterium]|nr:sortase [Clostridia bacterium]